MLVSKYFVWFIIYSFMGWIYESTYCTIRKHHWENRGFLHGPIVPIYGVGALLASILFSEFPISGMQEASNLKIFLICFFGSIVLEYTTSWALEKLFHAYWWDYSNVICNINGRVCLPASIGFGLAGILVVRVIYPFVSGMTHDTNVYLMEALSLVFMFLFGMDMALTISALTNFAKNFNRIESEINEQTYLLRPGATKDEVKIALGINVGSDAYDTAGAAYDFIGLFRTEFLYMENDHMPTEEEQFSVYRRILEGAKGKPVTLRTLDIGGDKTLPYFSLPKEDNPFLGERALRLCFSHMEIFETQMRAALRASVYGNLQIMFPMVGSMEDIRKAKEAVRKVMDALKQEGIAYDPKVKIGVMIEVPSLALQADLVAQEVDFASIGSNDLTQYVCAADRMNAAMEPYYQTYAPAMVRLLGFVFESFQKANKPISVCGEMAGNPKGAALLVGLGARKLSMNAAMLAAVKAELARHRIDELEKMAKTCQELCTEKEIKEQMEM